MKVKTAIVEAGEDPPSGLEFWCPACDEAHVIRVNKPGWWTWNGDYDKPTIGGDPKRSIKVETYKLSARGEEMIARGERVPEGQRYPGADYCCHSTITDGLISFCGDCTHAMVNQTVMLPDWPERPVESKADGDD